MSEGDSEEVKMIDFEDFVSQVSEETNLDTPIEEIPAVGGDVESMDIIGDTLLFGQEDLREQDIIQSVDKLINRTPIHNLSLTQLRELTIPLTDAVLSEELPIGVISPTHYSYWGWTGAVASQCNNPAFMDPDKESPLIHLQPLLGDFYELLDMVLSPVRLQQLDGRTRAYLSSWDPNGTSINKKSALRFVSNSGFQLLEGLLRRHCDEIDDDGTLKQEAVPLEFDWRTADSEEPKIFEKTSDSSIPSYSDSLHLWRENNASETVERVLKEIDNIDRDCYDKDDLIRKLGETDELESEIKRQINHLGNLFDILSKKRNYTLHGRGSKQIAGIIILNLCCLVIWDSITQQEYDELLEKSLMMELFRSVQSPEMKFSQNMHSGGRINDPFEVEWQELTDFYPLYDYERGSILAEQQQAMESE